MTYDHIVNGETIAENVSVNSTYVREVTSCGNPELLNLADYGFVERVVQQELPYIEPVPTSVTIRQACRQLEILGKYDIVEAAVATMSKAAQIDWQRATTVDRDYEFTQQMIALLEWTPEQADEYFTEASKL